MKRIFIALKVEPGETLLRLISSLKDELGSDDIRWTNPENIHVTLAFLGDTGEETIEDLKIMLIARCIHLPEFDFILKGCGVFRTLNDPRIIWVGIDPSKNLIDLNKSVKDGLKELKITVEDRQFNPHLTLGRIKHLRKKDILATLIEKYQSSEVQVVSVREVILYESILLKPGPIYKPLAKFKLKL